MDDHLPGDAEDHSELPDHHDNDPFTDERSGFDVEEQPFWTDDPSAGIGTEHEAEWSGHQEHPADNEQAPDLFSDTSYPDPAGDDHGGVDHGGVDDLVDQPAPDHHEPAHHDSQGDPPEHAIGADPDLPPSAGMHAWLDLPDLDRVTIPEPAGGPPWVDATLLGGDPTTVPADFGSLLSADAPRSPDPLHSAPTHPVGAEDDLRVALGEPVGAQAPDFADLLTSDDPAVRSLARLWGPPT